jgi:hypothetical protein
MTAAKEWHVDIFIGERDVHTHAEARLRTRDEVTLVGDGRARLNPSDSDVPEIGDEVAVARALGDLAFKLLHAAADDIEALTHEHVHIHV